MSTPAIAIAGRGAILATGEGPAALWQAAIEGREGCVPLRVPHLSPGRIAASAQVPEALDRACLAAVPLKLRRYCSPAVAWGVAAARQALAEAGLAADDRALRWGLYTAQAGYTHPSMAAYADLLAECRDADGLDRKALAARVLRRKSLDPFLVLKSLTNGLLGVTSLALGLEGEAAAFMEGVAGNHAALATATAALAAGRIDAALVVAAGSDLDALALRALARDGVLGTDAQARMRPFDSEAHGAVAGEGAVALVLRRASDAVTGAHGHEILLETGACHPDAHAVYAQAPPADLLVLAGSARADIDARLARGLPDGIDAPITACQAQTGLLGGAPCLANLVFAADALRHRLAPPMTGLLRPVAGRDFVTGAARPLRGNRAAVLSRDGNGVGAAYRLHLPSHPFAGPLQ